MYDATELTIKARDIKPGDYLISGHDNGGQSGRGGYSSIGIGSVRTHNGAIYCNGMSATYSFPADTIVTVERWS